MVPIMNLMDISINIQNSLYPIFLLKIIHGYYGIIVITKASSPFLKSVV